MPGKAFQSKLNPHWELIRDLRRHRKTWAEIAEILTKEHGCPTQTQAVHAYFKRRIKGRRPLGFEEAPSRSDMVAPDPEQAPGESKDLLSEYSRLSTEVAREASKPKKLSLKPYQPKPE